MIRIEAVHIKPIYRGYEVLIGDCGPRFAYKDLELAKKLRDLKMYLSGSEEYVKGLLKDSSLHLERLKAVREAYYESGEPKRLGALDPREPVPEGPSDIGDPLFAPT